MTAVDLLGFIEWPLKLGPAGRLAARLTSTELSGTALVFLIFLSLLALANELEMSGTFTQQLLRLRDHSARVLLLQLVGLC